jgi:hypothetical protein
MIDIDTLENILHVFKTKVGLVQLGKEMNVLKLIAGGKIYTFNFDLDSQKTTINFYMGKPPANNVLQFPLYMETLEVEYKEKNADEIGQEILDTIDKFDYSKSKLMEVISQIEIVKPKM